MLKLSKHCEKLCQVSLYVSSQIRGAFEAFARKATALQKVRISFEDRVYWEDGEEFQSRVTDAVTSFLGCPALNRLVINGRMGYDQMFRMEEHVVQDIANRCSRVRKQNPHLFVFVFGVEYLA